MVLQPEGQDLENENRPRESGSRHLNHLVSCLFDLFLLIFFIFTMEDGGRKGIVKYEYLRILGKF